MKLREIVYNIQNLIEKGIQSDDHRLSDLQIAFIIDQVRAYVISLEGNINRFRFDSLSQTISPFPMTLADESEACFLNTNCKVFKSNYDLPRVLKRGSVSSLNNVPFQPSEFTRTHWDKFSKFTSEGDKYYISDNRLWVPHKGKVSKLNLKMKHIFAEPTKVIQLQQTICNVAGLDCPSDPMDYDYPIPEEILKRMMYLIANQELEIFNRSTEDQLNNANQD